MVGLIWADHPNAHARARRGERRHKQRSAIGGARTAPGDTEGPAAQSIYPRAIGAPMPWVLPLCDAFHELPRVRRAECTGQKPGLAFTRECVRMLNAAVSSRALRIDGAGAQRCIAAETTRVGDCAFTRAVSLPAPAECSGVFRGRLDSGRNLPLVARVCRGPALPRCLPARRRHLPGPQARWFPLRFGRRSARRRTSPARPTAPISTASAPGPACAEPAKPLARTRTDRGTDFRRR